MQINQNSGGRSLRMLDICSNKITKLSLSQLPLMAHAERNHISVLRLEDLPSLNYLDVGRNNLTQIPPIITDEQFPVATVRLNDNKLKGHIPFCVLPLGCYMNPHLYNLDLSKNQLTGDPRTGTIVFAFQSKLVYGPGLCPPDGKYSYNYSRMCPCPPPPERRIYDLTENELTANTVFIVELCGYDEHELWSCPRQLDVQRQAILNAAPQLCTDSGKYLSDQTLECVPCASEWEPKVYPTDTEGWGKVLASAGIPKLVISNISLETFGTCSSCSYGHRHFHRTVVQTQECAGIFGDKYTECSFPCTQNQTEDIVSLTKAFNAPILRGDPNSQYRRFIDAVITRPYFGDVVIGEVTYFPSPFNTAVHSTFTMKICISQCNQSDVYQNISSTLFLISKAMLPGSYLGPPDPEFSSILILETKISGALIGVIVALVVCFLTGCGYYFHQVTAKIRTLPEDVRWSYLHRFTCPWK